MVARVVLASVAAASISAATLSAQTARLSRFDRGLSIIMLRQIKHDLREYYYDPTFHGIDIDDAFERAEARVRAAATLSDATAAIADLLAGMEDSHTLFYPPERTARVHYGWRATAIGDAAYVTEVTAGSDAERKGLHVGDRLLEWNGIPIARGNLTAVDYLYNSVRPQLVQRLKISTPSREERALAILPALEEHPLDRRPVPLDISAHARARAAMDCQRHAGEILVWRLSRFDEVAQVERALDDARSYSALVIDLRGNTGGSIDIMQTFVSRLFDREVRIGRLRTRHGEEPMRARASRTPFGGRLVVLVDSHSASAAEIAARVVQIEKRGLVVGDRTAGAVRASRVFPHTIGARAIVSWATSISIGEFCMSDGTTLEGAGVTPDEIVLPAATDLAAGRDPALARAVALLGGTLSAEQAGQLYSSGS